MSARTRQAAPAVACAHEADRRDCGACVAEAHQRAVWAAEVRMYAAPNGPQHDAACVDHLDAKAAKIGHALLWEQGIALLLRPLGAGGMVKCAACCVAGKPGALCLLASCPGRRVRFEAPAVRR